MGAEEGFQAVSHPILQKLSTCAYLVFIWSWWCICRLKVKSVQTSRKVRRRASLSGLTCVRCVCRCDTGILHLSRCVLYLLLFLPLLRSRPSHFRVYSCGTALIHVLRTCVCMCLFSSNKTPATSTELDEVHEREPEHAQGAGGSGLGSRGGRGCVGVVDGDLRVSEELESVTDEYLQESRQIDRNSSRDNRPLVLVLL